LEVFFLPLPPGIGLRGFETKDTHGKAKVMLDLWDEGFFFKNVLCKNKTVTNG
jgi:hypothetical protein